MSDSITAKSIFREGWIGRRPTARQIKAVELFIADNGGSTKGEILRQAGYGKATMDSPKRVFESRAVVMLMEDKGLSEAELIDVLKGRVHSAKEHIQLQALDMSFNLLGSYAPKKVESKNEHLVGLFSMADLRRKVKEKGIKITDPVDIIINKAQQNYE